MKQNKITKKELTLLCSSGVQNTLMSYASDGDDASEGAYNFTKEELNILIAKIEASL